MTISMAESASQWINAFPSAVGILGDYSPSNTIEGKLNPDFNQTRVNSGSYVIVYNRTTNNMTNMSIPAIALRESNVFDGHYFMPLKTGKRVHARKWSTLPINQEVVEKVATLANAESQPFLPGNVPIFEWAPGLEIDAIEQDDAEDILDDVNVQASFLPPVPISNIVSEDEDDEPGERHEDDESTISPPLPGEIPEEIIEQNGDEGEIHDSAIGCIDDVADADHTVDSNQYECKLGL